MPKRKKKRQLSWLPDSDEDEDEEDEEDEEEEDEDEGGGSVATGISAEQLDN